MKPRGIAVLIIAPGTVDTENYLNAEDPESIPANYQRIIAAGGLAPRSAIGSMIELIGRLTIDDIGVFHKWGQHCAALVKGADPALRTNCIDRFM